MGRVIRVGVNCWLGARVTIVKGVTIGHGSIIGACSLVTRDVPPFSLALGNPAHVVRRFDFAREAWVPSVEWSEEVSGSGPAVADYLASLRVAHPRMRMPVDGVGREVGDL